MNWIKKHYKFTLIVIVIGIGIPSLTWLLGKYFPEINQFSTFLINTWTILTAYIMLYYQIYREREKERKRQSLVLTQIEDLLYYIYENYEDILQLQNETKKKLSFLRTHHEKSLENINCYFTYQLSELIINTAKSTYYINPIDVKKREKEKIINISNDKKKIEQLINEIRESS